MSYYYETLGNRKPAYDAALTCMRNHGRSFRLRGVSSEELMPQILGDFPDLFYVAHLWQVRKSFFSEEEILPIYLYTPAEEKRLRQELEDAARTVLAEVTRKSQTEFEKVTALHDYLKSTVEYDEAAVSSVNVTNPRIAEAHSPVGALLRRRCVCDGYARGMKFLCDRAELDCCVVGGTGSSLVFSGPHSWNIVRINGFYHHVDVTWDHQFADNPSMPNYCYLNLSDEETARDHAWNRKLYPPCPDAPYNYFRVNQSLLDSRKQLERFLKEGFEAEEEALMFQVARGSRLEQEIGSCIQDCIFTAASRAEYVNVTSYHMITIEGHLVYLVQPQYAV